jgi:site-specific DNA-cytosine methylase
MPYVEELNHDSRADRGSRLEPRDVAEESTTTVDDSGSRRSEPYDTDDTRTDSDQVRLRAKRSPKRSRHLGIKLEVFSCAGGMAEGFRRAGITFDMAVDFTEDHCESYEKNLGHRPVRMDARDLLRMARIGWRVEVDLFVADPPCTPWSRAGKRLGESDDRDMLAVTCELVALLRPRRYLIGNVPGLDDNVNLPIVQCLIGGLSRFGYCTADFARLDAANYGVPQHRWRPFWFGHIEGPCIRWPAPTHGDPCDAAVAAPLPGLGLRPWVTCKEALGHLTGQDLGRAVKMRKRDCNTLQHGSVADRPARTVGTSNLSDGNVMTFDPHHPPSFADEPAMTVRAGCGGGLTRGMALSSRHDTPVHTSRPDQPSRAITTQCRAPGHATTIMLNEVTMSERKGRWSTKGPQSSRTMSPDAPSTTITAQPDRVGSGSPVLEWPWERPSTPVTSRGGLPPPGHHDEDFAILSLPDAIILSERAATILQGFPESWVFAGETKKARWSQIGQAMPPGLAEAVARAVVEQDER